MLLCNLQSLLSVIPDKTALVPTPDSLAKIVFCRAISNVYITPEVMLCLLNACFTELSIIVGI